MQKNTFCFKKQKSPALIAKDVFIALICFAFTFLSFKIVSPDTRTNADGAGYNFTPEGSSDQYYIYFSVESPSNPYMNMASNDGWGETYSRISGYTSCKEGFSIAVTSLDESTDFVNKKDKTKRITTVDQPTNSLADNTWGIYVTNTSSTVSGATYDPLPKRSETPYMIIDTSHQDYVKNNNVYGYLHYGMKVGNAMPAGDYYRELLYTTYTRTQCAGYTAYIYIDGKSEGSVTLSYGSLYKLSDNSKVKSLINEGRKNITSVKNRNTDETLDINTAIDINSGNSSSVYIDITTEEIPLNPTTFSGITNMQDMTLAICDAETTPLPTATEITFKHTDDNTKVPRSVLRDTRDGNTYLVSKLADGNCWMSQNLALDLTANEALTNADTDLRTKSSWTPQNSTQTSTGTTWNRTENAARSYHSNTKFRNGYNSSTTGTSTLTEYNWEKAGNYYNWYTATAGSSASSGNVSDSICPKGWHLPTSVNSANNKAGSYADLLDSYGIANTDASKLYAYPLNLLMGGMYQYNNGSMGYTSYEGGYWTSGSYSSSYPYLMSYSTSWSGTQIMPGRTNVYKGMGYPIRCTTGGTYTLNFDVNDFTTFNGQASRELNFGASITSSQLGTKTGTTQANSKIVVNDTYTVAYPTSSSTQLYLYTSKFDRVSNVKMNWYFQPFTSLTYLQDIGPENCAVATTPFKTATKTTTSHTTDRNLIPQKALRDYRDSKTYTVRKLANGECWIVQNLDYRFMNGSAYGYNAYTPAQAETSSKIVYTDLVDSDYYSRVDNAFSQSKFYATQSQPYTVGQTIDNAQKWGQTGSDGAHSYLNYYYRLSSTSGDNPGSDGQTTGTVENVYVARSDEVGSSGHYTFAETFKATSSSTVGTYWLPIGVYYNWTAAVAGKMDVTTGDAESSLCPKGWELPSATGAGSYSGVFNYYRNTTSSSNADDFNWAMEVMRLYPTGYYDWANTGYKERAVSGYFWTKSSVSSGTAKIARVGVSGTQISTNLTADKGVGASVRCVLRQASN